MLGIRTRIGNTLAVALMVTTTTLVTAPLASASAAADICGQFETTTVASGLYNVQNNHWNPQSSTSQQCLRVDGTSFEVTRADSVQPTNGAPASYPSIYLGCHYSTCTTNSDLPQQVASAKQVRVKWSTVQPAEGAYNVSLDLWFDSNPGETMENEGELMVWLAHRGGVQPIGTQQGRTTLGGVTYEVWASETTRRPQVVTYQRVNHTTSIDGLDVRLLTRDARSRGYFSDSWHLTSIQAGFELWRAPVGVRTTSFSVSTS